MNDQKVIDLLNNHELFKGLDIGFRAEHFEVFNVEKHSLICSDCLIYIVSGVVESFVTNSKRKITLDFYSAGKVIGESNILNKSRPRNLYFEKYKALSDTRIICVPVAVVETIIKTRIKFNYRLCRFISRRKTKLQNKMILCADNVGSKVKQALLYLAGRIGIKDDRGTVLSAKIPQHMIASFVNCSREHCNVELQVLITEGFVEYDSRKRFIIKGVGYGK